MMKSKGTKKSESNKERNVDEDEDPNNEITRARLKGETEIILPSKVCTKVSLKDFLGKLRSKPAVTSSSSPSPSTHKPLPFSSPTNNNNTSQTTSNTTPSTTTPKNCLEDEHITIIGAPQNYVDSPYRHLSTSTTKKGTQNINPPQTPINEKPENLTTPKTKNSDNNDNNQQSPNNNNNTTPSKTNEGNDINNNDNNNNISTPKEERIKNKRAKLKLSDEEREELERHERKKRRLAKRVKVTKDGMSGIEYIKKLMDVKKDLKDSDDVETLHKPSLSFDPSYISPSFDGLKTPDVNNNNTTPKATSTILPNKGQYSFKQFKNSAKLQTLIANYKPPSSSSVSSPFVFRVLPKKLSSEQDNLDE